jgi:hypothetical protein
LGSFRRRGLDRFLDRRLVGTFVDDEDLVVRPTIQDIDLAFRGRVNARQLRLQCGDEGDSRTENPSVFSMALRERITSSGPTTVRNIF